MNIGQALGWMKVLEILRSTQTCAERSRSNDSLGMILICQANRKSPVQLLNYQKKLNSFL